MKINNLPRNFRDYPYIAADRVGNTLFYNSTVTNSREAAEARAAGCEVWDTEKVKRGNY